MKPTYFNSGTKTATSLQAKRHRLLWKSSEPSCAYNTSLREEDSVRVLKLREVMPHKPSTTT